MDNDVVYTRFDAELIASLMLPIVNIYKNAEDYPGRVVARLYDGNSPTNAIMISDSHDEIADRKPVGMISMPRTAADSTALIETWI